MSIVNRFPGATIIESPWYGFPTIRAPRRVRPTILCVNHVTDGLGSAEATTEWGIGQKDRSWTFCLNRDGSVVQSLDPILHTPWTNGDVNHPDLSNPLIAEAVASGKNFNEYCLATVESVGVPDTHPITTAQRDTLRRLHTWLANLSELPMTRERIIGHYQVNSVTRQNCPVVPRERPQYFSQVIPVGLPDTSTPPPEVDMYEWVSDAKAESFNGSLAAGTNIRSAPRIARATLMETLAAPLSITVTCRVWGAAPEFAPDNHWWLGFIHAQHGLVLAHASQVTDRTSLTADLERQLAASTAKTATVKDASISALLIVASIAKNRADKIKEM